MLLQWGKVTLAARRNWAVNPQIVQWPVYNVLISSRSHQIFPKLPPSAGASFRTGQRINSSVQFIQNHHIELELLDGRRRIITSKQLPTRPQTATSRHGDAPRVPGSLRILDPQILRRLPPW